MGSATVRTGKDTWVESARPGKNYGGNWLLYVQGNITTKLAYLYFPNPAPRGAVITNATLSLVVRDAWGGAKQISTRRVTQSFAMSKVTYNTRPSATNTGAWQAYVTPSPDKRGGRVELDVTNIVQAWSNGAPNYGIEVGTPGGLTKFYSLNNSAWRPYLHVEWEDRPHKPNNLKPASGVVSGSHPTLSFDFVDVSGNTKLAAIQVQVDPDKNGSSPDFDSGEVTVTSPELSLADTAYPGLAPGEATSWRVRAKDGAGLWSQWSDWATFERVPKGTLELLNPNPDADPVVIEDVTPPIVWSFDGGAYAQRAYQVLISTPDKPNTYLHNSGQIKSATADTYTLPAGVLKGTGPYRLKVRVYDTAAREATPGDPLYVQARVDFTVAATNEVTPPNNLVAAPSSEGPEVHLTWERTNAPDRWTVLRNGQVIAADLLPDETLTTPGVYEWVDYQASPGHTYAYEVRAVVNNRQSESASAAPVTLPIRAGIFLTDPTDGFTVAIAGDDAGTWAEPEESEVFVPLGASVPVRVVYAQRGYEGSLSGTLVDGFNGLTIEEQIDRLYAIKSNPATRLRLIVADVSIPVIVGNLTIAPSPTSRAGQVLREVSFDFWQVDEFAFDTP